MVDPTFPSTTPRYTVTREGPATTVMTTSTLKATIDMASEHITFYDVASGTKLTADFAHRFVPTTDPALGNASSYVLSQSWQLAPDEGLCERLTTRPAVVGFSPSSA